jgi:phosphate starvation-inducible PhoH-like protein
LKGSNGRAGEAIVNHLDLEDPRHARDLVGAGGANVKMVEQRTGASITSRGNRLIISGGEESVAMASRVINQLYSLVERGYPISPEDIQKAMDMISEDSRVQVKEVFLDAISIPSASRQIAPKTPGQKHYVQMIREMNMVFAIGPAGTGKTYLAVAMAVSALLNRQFKRLVLARPAVEAGEKLGFLPGDIAEKVNPYLRPLYDSLDDMMEIDRVHKLIERGVIEIAPLAFMRGRTLNDSFVILDEAQNTTPEQMKMFLTRLGFNSKAVVTGDITQIDLPVEKPSGLIHASHILRDVEGVAFCRLTSRDVVRHPLVARIIEAYEKDATQKRENGG